jgi:hypothetical protein
MSLGLNKILLANAATNGAGAYFQAYSAGNATVTLPAGTYYITPTANVTIELNKDTTGNISNASWAVVVANNTGGLFIADGTNVRANVLAGTPTITLFTVDGGQAVSGTYNT